MERLIVYIFLGHSLGAQTCGFFGQEFGRLESILGLDPAGPIFEANFEEQKLSTADAKYVQILHSNTNNYGHLAPIGSIKIVVTFLFVSGNNLKRINLKTFFRIDMSFLKQFFVMIYKTNIK